MVFGDQCSGLFVTTNSILLIFAGEICLSAFKYCPEKLCNCRRHVSSGTATVRVPSAYATALVFSPILLPQASGHASKGASAPSLLRALPKIFRKVELACCIALSFDCRTECDEVRLLRERKLTEHERQRLFPIMQRAFQLRVLHRRENLAELRSRLVSQLDEVASVHQCRRTNLFHRRMLQPVFDEVIHLQLAMAAQAIDAVQFHVLLELRQPHEAL